MSFNYSEIKEFLEGKYKFDRANEIREWLINPQNESEVRKTLGEIWKNSQIKLKGDKPDFDLLLNKLHYRMNAKSNAGRKGNFISQLYISFAKIAAILIIPLLLFTAYLYFNPRFNQLDQKSAMREVYTKPGTRTHVELPDGTLVWLNDGTVLKYPERFTGDSRQVFVDGEAYFEVKSNPQNTFIVDNPIMKTIVTGTRFNLNAYSTDDFFEATLLEGKIHLEGKAGNIELNPGEQIQFDAITNRLARNEVNPKNAAAWINGRLIIHNEKLGMAIKKLSRWYNVEIQLNNQELNDYELTCTLENEKIDQCLSLISHALPIKYNFTEEQKKQGHINYKIQLMRK